MEISGSLKQVQKLTLSPQMQLSLRCLQLSVQELDAYLSEAALSNPVIDYESSLLHEAPEQDGSAAVSYRDDPGGGFSHPDPQWDSLEHIAASQTLSDYLIWQLTNIKFFDQRLYPVCEFLIHCLNADGYLDCSLDELARECGCSLFDLEQALFVIQELDPPGIGARNLTECLLLQLAQTPHFSAATVHLVRYGLPLLARKDYKGLASLLKIPEKDVKEAAACIRTLNPIPSNGFGGRSPQPYTVPEAVLHCEEGKLSVELYSPRWRHLSYNKEYLSMIGDPAYGEAQDYLKQKKREAEDLIAAVENRDQLIRQIIRHIVQVQQDYFLGTQPLKPMTMNDIAQALGVNVSTVSRAIREKYILVGTKSLSLRSLFSSGIEAADGTAVSPEYAKLKIRHIISAEDKASPLSDQAICEALQGMGVLLSRRTVASYRKQLGLPGARERKNAAE